MGSFSILRAGGIALACAVPVSSFAAKLEEVLVTAQHREQSLQDVPVSVSAIGGEKMLEAGINRMEDLQAYVPNLTVTESGISTDIYVRGIGTGMNQGFERASVARSFKNVVARSTCSFIVRPRLPRPPPRSAGRSRPLELPPARANSARTSARPLRRGRWRRPAHPLRERRQPGSRRRRA